VFFILWSHFEHATYPGGGVDVHPVPVTDFYLGLPYHLLKSCIKEISASLLHKYGDYQRDCLLIYFSFEGGWHWGCFCWCSVAVGPAAASAEKDCSSTIQQSKFVLTLPAFCVKGTGNWKNLWTDWSVRMAYL